MKKIITLILLNLFSIVSAHQYIPDPSAKALVFTRQPTHNQLVVAQQFDSILVPTPDQIEVLLALDSLSGNSLNEAMDESAGEQYTYWLGINQFADRRFAKRIYNSFKDLLVPCAEIDVDCFDTWIAAEGARSIGKGDHNARGFKSYNYDISLGIHTFLCPELWLGGAFNYEEDNIRFNQGGRNHLHTTQAAIYAGWQNNCFYVFSDLIFGTSWSHFHRPIRFADIDRHAHSSPCSLHGRLYTEAGWNFTPCDYLIQPFLGIDTCYFHLSKFNEHKADSLDLRIGRRTTYTYSTYLGVHLRKDFCQNWSANIDLAWQHRFDKIHHLQNLHVRFREFGDPFKIQGCDQERDGLQAALNISTAICECFEIYAEVNTEWWSRWCTYGIDAGLSFRW